MFISRKKYMELLHRVNALERKTEVQTFDFGTTDLKKLCRELPGFVDKRSMTVFSKLFGLFQFEQQTPNKMNIIQATTVAIATGRCIRRKSWHGRITINPTDICYEVISEYNETKKRHPFWNPKTDDVLADDWIVVD